jgi:hypothetical protein
MYTERAKADDNYRIDPVRWNPKQVERERRPQVNLDEPSRAREPRELV